MKSQVAIILVEPEIGDNIGSVARAMKNTGFSDLRLVKPVKNWPERANVLAVKATDILKSAKEYSSVDQAIKGCQWVVGMTCRTGRKRGGALSFPKLVEKVKKMDSKQKIAILFGKESKGLSNKDLSYCEKRVMIPSHKSYPAFNLAQAVMIVCFSLFQSSIKPGKSEGIEFCAREEVFAVVEQYKKVLKSLNYEHPRGLLMEKIAETLQGLMFRAGLQPKEANMFRGLFRRILQRAGDKKNAKLDDAFQEA